MDDQDETPNITCMLAQGRRGEIAVGDVWCGGANATADATRRAGFIGRAIRSLYCSWPESPAVCVSLRNSTLRQRPQRSIPPQEGGSPAAANFNLWVETAGNDAR